MINMKQIKNFLGKNYYATGAIIGFLIGIFPMFLILIDKFILLSDLLLYIPRRITMSDYFSFEEGLVLTPILTISLYTFLGLFIAFLFKKLKPPKKK